MSKHAVRKFWPLDYDSEVEIYETLSWDLAGCRPARKGPSPIRATAHSEPKRS